MNTKKQLRVQWKTVLPASVLLSGVLLAGCGASADQTATTETPATASSNNQANNTGTTNTTPDATTGSDSASTTAGATSTTSTASNSNTAIDPLIQERENSSLQSTIKKTNGKMVITDPESMTVIVNKKRSLPDGYIPPDLVVPDVAFSYDGVLEKSHMRKEAAGALEKLFAASKKAGLDLRAVSGYRSYKRQVTIYNNNVATKGQAYTDRVSAKPGTSEHQTGLAIDVSGPGIGYGLEQSFGATAEGKWLAKHAAEYGFVIRYKKGADSITGYTWEPWHIRYIGKELAEDVTAKNLTLEEYFDEDHIQK